MRTVAVIAGILASVVIQPRASAGARLETSGYLDGLGVIGTEDGHRQYPSALAEVRLDGSLGRRLAGRLTLRGHVGGPFREVEPGLFNFVHEFQSLSPSLEVNEGYVDLHLARADVRAGIQKISWG